VAGVSGELTVVQLFRHVPYFAIKMYADRTLKRSEVCCP